MGGGYGQGARGRRGAQGIQGLRHIEQGVMHAGKQARALIGEAHAARHALKQRKPHMPLQRLDLMGHCRGRYRQFGRGQLEAAKPGRRLKCAQRGNR